ncbi:MAG: sulfatase-like hydrolase/transferase [Anaerolineaceae bacterium]|nr:sulfatase-like hydrolase/transferase [Anaerolineaceae bacterium]
MAEDQPRGISRRSFLKRAAITGGALAVAGVGGKQYHDICGRDFQPERTAAQLARIELAADPDKLLNIVLIYVDDLGYGDIGPYGVKLIETPNLDSMAAEGATLTNFYSAAPVCTPSRAALLTGRYAMRSHLPTPLYPHRSIKSLFLNLVVRHPYNVTGIPEDELLLSEVLQMRGYRTGLVGKWHLGDHSPHLPNENGFDFFYGAYYSNSTNPYRIYRNAEIEIDEPVNQDLLTKNHTSEAIRFIRENRDRPFFLYLAHPMVHEPVHASLDFQGRSQAGLYGDAVEELDWSVGEVLETLAELGLDERTLVIFTSDNGPWWQGSPGDARGRKNNVFDGGMRVPFLARWPGVIPAGMTNDAWAVNFDLYPTLLNLAGVPLPDDRIIDGLDILPLLVETAGTPHETFYYYDGPVLVAVRHHDWKYHQRHWTDNGGYPLIPAGPFLFDLANDPSESYSMIATQPELAGALAQMLGDWDAEFHANQRGWLPKR